MRLRSKFKIFLHRRVVVQNKIAISTLSNLGNARNCFSQEANYTVVTLSTTHLRPSLKGRRYTGLLQWKHTPNQHSEICFPNGSRNSAEGIKKRQCNVGPFYVVNFAKDAPSSQKISPGVERYALFARERQRNGVRRFM